MTLAYEVIHSPEGRRVSATQGAGRRRVGKQDLVKHLYLLPSVLEESN